MSSKASSTKAPTTPDHWDHIRARSIVIIITSNFILKTSIVLIIIITCYAVPLPTVAYFFQAGVLFGTEKILAYFGLFGLNIAVSYQKLPISGMLSSRDFENLTLCDVSGQWINCLHPYQKHNLQVPLSATRLDRDSLRLIL